MAATVASTHLHWFLLGDAGGGTGRDLGGVGGAGGVGFCLHSVTSSFMVVAPFFLFTCDETSCVCVASAMPALYLSHGPPQGWMDGFSC